MLILFFKSLNNVALRVVIFLELVVLKFIDFAG